MNTCKNADTVLRMMMNGLIAILRLFQQFQTYTDDGTVIMNGWLVGLLFWVQRLFWDSISVYNEPFPRDFERDTKAVLEGTLFCG